MLYIILLGLAVSMDSFVAGAAYGMKNIKISRTSLAVVGAITALCTAWAMILAQTAGMLISEHIAMMLGSLLLLLIGLWSIFQEYLTRGLTPYDPDSVHKITFRFGKLVIYIMANPEAVDTDHSNSISPSEAFFLGLALGLDNAVAAFAASLLGVLPWYAPVVMGIIQTALLAVGIQTGKQAFPESLKKKFPYLPGTLLMIIGVIRLIK